MDIKCNYREWCCSKGDNDMCTAAVEDACDKGVPNCLNWDNAQSLCRVQYPSSCELRYFCQHKETQAFKRADYADRQRSGSGSY